MIPDWIAYLIAGAIGVLLALVVWWTMIAIRFANGPAPIEYSPEMPWIPAIRPEAAQRERFGDADCRTDWDVVQEARRLHRQAVDRAEKAWLN